MTSIIEFPLLDRTTQNSVISTTSSDLSNWSRLSSLWPLLYGTSCCFIEFASLIGSRFDFDRYGLVPRSSPRQADLILTAGTVTMKMAPSLVRLYEQMPEPKYVIAMGACTITGGMFSTDSYSTVRGVDKLIPVDVYLPGCPPKPEAVIDAITKLRKKISREIYEDRIRSQQENRCFTTSHKFRVGRSTHTGNYDQGLLYQPPSTSEIPPEIFFKYKIKHGLVHRSLGFDYQGIETLQIKPEDWHSIAVILYVYGYNYLRSQCAYDVAPGGLLASVYHLTRIEYGIDQPEEVCIKVFASRRNPRIPSVFWVWKSADFQERESYDMLGILYDNHPRLKRILMPESWIGWPLQEKQKLRFHYGLTEQQLLKYVRIAGKAKGSTGQVLLQLLEMRLDNILFRLAQSEGNYAEALQNYYEAMRLEIDPYDRSYILYNIGLIHTSNGEHTKALEYYFRALERNPFLPQAFNNMAVICHYVRLSPL
ncbi:NADH dehydrogenase I subunit K [Vigna unguiculata]|uniref:NAD(P)H dehydrogenase subunit J n=2 Tax=fabids TaxID=91835 RepID=A0A4D6NPI7_VIGUN|nr:NADH dehydrogenase I subunit K [Vigna unguiculata]